MSEQQATFEALPIDPRKVERYERYLRAYARTHALDPLEHRRRDRAGCRFLAALRCRASVLGAIAEARESGLPFLSPAKPRLTAWARLINWR